MKVITTSMTQMKRPKLQCRCSSRSASLCPAMLRTPLRCLQNGLAPNGCLSDPCTQCVLALCASGVAASSGCWQSTQQSASLLTQRELQAANCVPVAEVTEIAATIVPAIRCLNLWPSHWDAFSVCWNPGCLPTVASREVAHCWLATDLASTSECRTSDPLWTGTLLPHLLLHVTGDVTRPGTQESCHT
ncbi:uncharacterized protein LOC126282524 [Schistocerca gregaria]|uniref:uncharacterized protein LOC126282524 n=1 Tax=Schistocerca gregaria TaxID=7010 RepID=UPI00211EF63B|nr:uncharacterized protein LOC126282524 [Schistocerca gregaria]